MLYLVKNICKCICVLFFAFISLAASGIEVYKTTSDLKFRKAPSSKSHSYGVIKEGTNVNVIDVSNKDWFQVENNGTTGFLSSKYLEKIQVERKQIVQPQIVKEESSSSVFLWIIILAALIWTCVLIMKKRSRLADEKEIEENLMEKRIAENKAKSEREFEAKKKLYETKEKMKDDLKNQFLSTFKVTVSTSYDNSVIDVTGKGLDLNHSNNKPTQDRVPIWAHQYIYSFSEIKSANQAQINFYRKYRDAFLNSEYLNLEGNNNYAFILLFDLLNDYENHKNISKLEAHLECLGEKYPKTRPYAVTSLIDKFKGIRDTNNANRVAADHSKDFKSTEYSYDESWRLGTKYKTKLNLSEEEVQLLNNLWYPSNNFCSIEFCCLETLKIFIATIVKLKEQYTSQNSTIEEQFLFVANVVAKKEFNYRQGSANYNYCLQSTAKDFYSNIFKYCENVVRDHYGHKRKINTDTIYSKPEVKLEFETRIISKISEIFPTLVSSILPPDLDTEVALYSQNTNRWKIKFEELTSNYKGNPKQFIENIVALGELNKKNPSIENIFFEASKFISKYDKESALSLYIYYLYYDLKSATFDNKQLTKTIQKSLFTTNEQLIDFQVIVSQLIKDKNLGKALQALPKIYEVKRKKIQLDKDSIKEVQHQHSGTVELLNEYLKDEYEDHDNSVKSKEIDSEVIEIEIIPKNEVAVNSIYLTSIPFTLMHTTTLGLFAKNSFSLLQSELETFSKSKGIFKNQLIDSINEVCYENLDDVLIEEEDEYYTINPDYYQRLLTT